MQAGSVGATGIRCQSETQTYRSKIRMRSGLLSAIAICDTAYSTFTTLSTCSHRSHAHTPALNATKAIKQNRQRTWNPSVCGSWHADSTATALT